MECQTNNKTTMPPFGLVVFPYLIPNGLPEALLERLQLVVHLLRQGIELIEC